MIISYKHILILSMTCALGPPSPLHAESIVGQGVEYDSAADWSNGAPPPDGRWSYGAYAGAGSWNTFTPLTNYAAGGTAIGGSGDRWGAEPAVGQYAQFPSASMWAVRRWTSDMNGGIEIEYDVSRLDDEAGDNGQIAGVYKNGVQLWSRDLGSAPDGRQYTGVLPTTVAQGDVIDFTVDSKGNNLADWTHFWARIRTRHLRPAANNGLVAHWKLDESSSFPTGFGYSRQDRSADWSGHNEPIVPRYMTPDDWITGRIGNTLDFDGGNDHATTLNPDLTDGATALTLSAWISPDSQGGWRGVLTTKDPQYFGFNSTGYTLNAIEFRANNTRVETEANAIPFSSWTLVTCVWKSGQIFKIYLNGEDAPLGLSASAPSTSIDVGTWYIGSDRLIGGRYFNGRIDDVALWSRALSAAEIHELYRLGINGWDASYLGNAPTGSKLNPLPYARGLNVWLDGEDMDGKGNTTLSNGDEVTRWFNKAGGHAADATAADNALRLGVFNKDAGPRERDVLRLGSDDLDGLQFDEFLDTDTFSLFAVAKTTGGQGSQPLFTDQGATAQTEVVFGAGTNESRVTDASGDTLAVTPSAPLFTQWNAGLLILSKDGGTFTLEAGSPGATVSATNPSYGSTTWEGGASTPHVGKKGGAGYADSVVGEIAELLIYDHALSTTDRDAVLDYLDKKYFQHEGGTLIKIR